MDARNEHGEIVSDSIAFTDARNHFRSLDGQTLPAVIYMQGDPRDGSVIDITLPNGIMITLQWNGQFTFTDWNKECPDPICMQVEATGELPG